MKVAKPVKTPILTRIVEWKRRPQLHVAAMLGFPLGAPRALIDEVSLWPAVMSALGETGVLDEGIRKARGELLVSGCFHAPGGEPIGASYVGVRCAGIDKRLSVVGDRHWKDGVPTEPEPMTNMPIDWAHAFGGQNYERNPYGKGATAGVVDGQKVRPLPNIEPFERLIRKPSQKPEPAGLLPMDVTFAQRRQRAGTYDKTWFEHHFPGLPADADLTFFNAAPADQWLDGFFQGDEELAIENMHPEKPLLEGHLPGLTTRCFITQLRGGGPCFIEIPMRCDTVWLFPEAELGVVIFHGSTPVAEDDAAYVVHLLAACEDPAHPRTADHYRHALARRLDEDDGALEDLSDSDLMPPLDSGVAPNIGETDIGNWVKGDNLLAENLRRGVECQRAEARANCEAEGMDPAAYGLADPLPPDPQVPDDPDAQVAFVKEQRERAERETKKLDEMKVEAEAQAREQCAEIGVDFDDMMAEGQREAAGPPKFSATEQLDMMHDMAEIGSDGDADDPLLAMVDDPDYQAQLVETEQSLREMYLKHAHLQPAAAPLDEGASAQARVVVQAAVDSDTSLAERDLTGADLSGMKLGEVDLSGAFLEAANLSGCDLRGANLENAVLARANLADAQLDGATLCGANLGGAVLAGASFDGCDLTEAVLSRAKLAGARLTDAKLASVDLLETEFGDVDLSRSSLPECSVIKADLSGAKLTGADLTKSTFIECTFDRADLAQARLEKATFVTCRGKDVSFREAAFAQGVMVHGSAFPGADFRDADLERANLRGTVLTGARLDRANLRNSDLSECDITTGSLERAVLTEAMLVRTKLDGASAEGANLMDALMSKSSLRGTNLTGSNLYRADLSRAVGDSRTTLKGAEVGKVRFLPKADQQPLEAAEATPEEQA